MPRSMNYRRERNHDKLLIDLARALSNANRLDLLAAAFEIDDSLGPLTRAEHRRPFDVELTFVNMSIVIESKVDSDENGRWEEQWQTKAIVNNAENLHYLRSRREYRFITYGTSEFYTKADNGHDSMYVRPGPYSPEFKHIGLDRMICLVESAKQVLPFCGRREEWYGLMLVEKKKRIQAPQLLHLFAEFRQEYIQVHGENDFPRSRLLFCAPELAFPVFHLIAGRWNGSEHAQRLGKVLIYPVGRGAPGSPPVQDSILNFWELWQGETLHLEVTRNTLDPRQLYFEINEDFNLNLKSAGDIPVDGRRRIWTCMDEIDWPDFAIGCRRNYRQDALVLYELDFGLLINVNDMAQVVKNLAEVMDTSIRALAEID